MNITIGGDAPLPSFQWRDDVLIDDEALEGEVHTSQLLGGGGMKLSKRRGSLR